MTEQEARKLEQEWNEWREQTPEYLETEENNAKLTEELRTLASAGHPLGRATLELAVKNLASRGEISLLSKTFVKKAAPAAEPVFESKRFAQDTLTSGAGSADGRISILKIREWEKERAEEKQFQELQAKVQAAKEKDARNAPEPEEISGELPLSLMDSPTEEARVLSLPSVTPAKIRRYIARKQEEQMRRAQEAARGRR